MQKFCDSRRNEKKKMLRRKTVKLILRRNTAHQDCITLWGYLMVTLHFFSWS